MNSSQIWQTIALNLKRAANLLAKNRKQRAKYFLDEAKQLYEAQKDSDGIRISKNMVSFEGDPEDILLGSTVIMGRI
jgi:hypothetical protein